MQDPSNPTPNPSQNPSSHPRTEMASSVPSPPTNAPPFRGAHHRRAHSEVHFRLPDELDLVSDPLFEELGSEDDLFCTYMDIEKFGSGPDASGQSAPKHNNGAQVERPRHRHSNSVDGASMLESIEAKKAIAPDKLAELWSVDPKRAKRFVAFYSCMNKNFVICICVLFSRSWS